MESHPKSQLSNNKNSRAMSVERFKPERTTIDDKIIKQEFPRQIRYPTIPLS